MARMATPSKTEPLTFSAEANRRRAWVKWWWEVTKQDSSPEGDQAAAIISEMFRGAYPPSTKRCRLCGGYGTYLAPRVPDRDRTEEEWCHGCFHGYVREEGKR